MTGYESVLRRALELPAEGREQLVALLKESLPFDEEACRAWSVELQRRIREIDEGKAEMMDWEDAEKLIFPDE